MAIEAGGLGGVVAAVGAGCVWCLQMFVARNARSEVLFAIGGTSVGAANMRIMAMGALELRHAGARILLQGLQRVVERRSIGPSTEPARNVTLPANGVHRGGILPGVDHLTLDGGALAASGAGNFVIGRSVAKQRV